MSELVVTAHQDPREFFILTQSLWMAHEAENQIMLAMLTNLATIQAPFEFMWIVSDGARVVGAAAKNRGSNYKLIVSRLDESSASALAKACMGLVKEPLAGVLGVANTAEIFARAWQRVSGCSLEIYHRQGILSAVRLTAKPRVSGMLRPAQLSELDLMVDWRRRFISECGLDQEAPADSLTRTQKLIERQGLWLWTVGDRVVSMLSAGTATPNAARISLVYTPVDLRGNSYASACVYAASAASLASGKRFCCLYTDLANPVSNKIYERIGYERVAEALDIRFLARAINEPARR